MGRRVTEERNQQNQLRRCITNNPPNHTEIVNNRRAITPHKTMTSTSNANKCNKNKSWPFNFALTNARSLSRKLESLYTIFKETELHFAIVTETWFCDQKEADRINTDAAGRHGIHFINRMRKRSGNTNPGGGVSIIFKKRKILLKEYPITRGRHEIVATKGKIQDNSRPIYIIAVYISTKLRAAGRQEVLALLSTAIMKIKTESRNP